MSDAELEALVDTTLREQSDLFEAAARPLLLRHARAARDAAEAQRTEWLDGTGLLLDVPRLPGESNDAYQGRQRARLLPAPHSP